jgi:hypothetical protein
VITVLITVIGAAMMTITSSPAMKGAAFLWLPAALQLIGGVWLGPIPGMLAGGLGAYAAGILAYGGVGLPDIVMNLVAGGLANAWLPAVLFRAFKINPDFGAEPQEVRKAVKTLVTLLVLVLVVAVASIPLKLGFYGFIAALVLLLAAPAALRNLKLAKRDFILAFVVCVFSCAVSAAIGCYGVVLSGQSWLAAIVGTGVGWFLGDTVSAVLGLYILATFTQRARRAGLADRLPS